MDANVSIIVPTYNRRDVIPRAIKSILRQTYSAYEILVVDDGSTDDTAAVINEMEDSRIRYIALKENKGAAHARNIGIQEAKCDYIAFLDSDDEWMPRKLELQMKKMLNLSEEYGLTYCRMGGMCRDGKNRYTCPAPECPKGILEGDMFKVLLLQNVIGTPTVLARKACIEQAGGFKENLRCLEDWELFLRISRNWRIGFVDKLLVEVHKSTGSVSTNMAWYLIARCYMVSLYRQDMLEFEMLDMIQSDILQTAKRTNLYEETKELLGREIEL